MTIRQANLNDIEKIMKMYNSCVAGMIKIGIDQWDNTYPNKEIILHDIQNKTFYVITDEKQNSDSSELNNQINEFIDTYFISSGPNENRPTQYAIDIFNDWKMKKPMNDIYMNKMRDMVYYVLQIIIPGLPTDQLPRSYVAWRPIVWMSRSEKPNSV